MIEWLIQRAQDNSRVAAGLPPAGLLSPPETAVFEGLQSAKRRRDWILGRWTAKQLVQTAVQKRGGQRLNNQEMAILAAADGAPELWRIEADRLLKGNYTLSISHSGGVSLCAAVPGIAYLLGADIEKIETRSRRFASDYFTAGEREYIQGAPVGYRDMLITAIWSGKEAALKAVRQGLRLDTRSISCLIPSPAWTDQTWQPFTIQWSDSAAQSDAPALAGWWRIWNDFVLTMAVSKTPAAISKKQITH